MQKKVDDLIAEIRGVLREPLNAYLHELLAAYDSLEKRVADTDRYHEARESVLNEIHHTLSAMQVVLHADSQVVKLQGWGRPLHDMALRFNGPTTFLSASTLPEVTQQTKDRLKDALIDVQARLEALIDPDERVRLKEEHRGAASTGKAMKQAESPLPADLPGHEKIRMTLDRAKSDLIHYLALGGNIHMPLTIRVSPQITPQARREVEARLGGPPYRPQDEHSYVVRSGGMHAANLRQLLAMDEVTEVNYAGALKAPAKKAPRLR